MPYSNNFFDKKIGEILEYIKPNKFYDFGAGAGKYGDIIKEKSKRTYSIAIESEKDYIEKFNLVSKYNKVFNFSILNFLHHSYYNNDFDVVMFGDVIEHLKKSDGLDLLNFLVYRTRWIIVEFPQKYLQNPVDGHFSEAHISIWGKNDFCGFDVSDLINQSGQCLIIIKGYLEDKITIKQMNNVLNSHEK